eukprot:maker-scaffold_11-snap-gene-12.15-mRNA-1 protein AED:0.01 eAED:0.01 QI:544/1/1/1/0.5/0.33/3/560/515
MAGVASAVQAKKNMILEAENSENQVKNSDEEEPRGKLERQLTSTFDKQMLMDVNDVADADREQAEIVDLEKLKENELEGVGKQVATESGSSDNEQEESEAKLRILTGEATDIGGGSVNQDKSCCFRTGKNEEHLVAAVFDGHGRELGELAAIVARDFVRNELLKEEVLTELGQDPKKVFERIFEDAHLEIKDRFRRKIEESTDWDVFEDEAGFLVKKHRARAFRKNVKSPRGKRSSLFQTFLRSAKIEKAEVKLEEEPKIKYISEANVHGGTTATVVVILNHKRVLVANVGDSTALFGGMKNGTPMFKELSAEHSPEAPDEYLRVQQEFANSDKCLRFVFDVLDRNYHTTPKYACPPIFKPLESGSEHVEIARPNGFYYKNVRSEWATLVTTPPTAKFQDALAFTRSLGDLHLHVYGVSYVPEVQEFDLDKLVEESASGAALLLVCSDGVWDNWKYQDIIRKTMSSPLWATTLDGNSAQTLTNQMMEENIRLAKQHFGSQADNMTGIVCVIKPDN